MFLPEFQGGWVIMLWFGSWIVYGIFYVHSFYNSLLKATSVSFPWQSIWCVKIPKRLSFFLWTAARGGILTIDNLVKKNLPFLIGVAYVNVMRKLWITFYSIVVLLMLCGVRFFFCLGFNGWCRIANIVVSLLFAWRNWLGNHSSNVWNMVLACLMWWVSKERNAWTFEDTERPIYLLKNLLARTLFEWSCIWGLTHGSSLSFFLISVRVSIWFFFFFFFLVLFSLLWVYNRKHIALLLSIKLLLPIKKKSNKT